MCTGSCHYGKWKNKGPNVDRELKNGEQDNWIPVGEAAKIQVNLFRIKTH